MKTVFRWAPGDEEIESDPPPFSLKSTAPFNSWSNPNGELHIESFGIMSAQLALTDIISINELTDVKRHDITSTDELVSHALDFVDGSSADFAYNREGQLQILKFAGLEVSVFYGRMILLRCHDHASFTLK